jgi:hypothetical protein
MQKICYLSGMLYYSASALTIFVSPLPGILLIFFNIELLKWYNLAFAGPIIIYGWFVYRVWGRSKHSMCVQLSGVMQQYAHHWHFVQLGSFSMYHVLLQRLSFNHGFQRSG